MAAFWILLAVPLASHALTCRNLAPVESQEFPERLELVRGKAGKLSVRVLEKGSDNAAVATEGHEYPAARLPKAEEARFHVPSYYVSDNSLDDRFADDERDTATYLFLEPAVLGKGEGHAKLWLHYRGNGYRGVKANRYACREGKEKP